MSCLIGHKQLKKIESDLKKIRNSMEEINRAMARVEEHQNQIEININTFDKEAKAQTEEMIRKVKKRDYEGDEDEELDNKDGDQQKQRKNRAEDKSLPRAL